MGYGVFEQAALLKRCFDCCPGGFWVVFRDNNGYLVADVEAEVRHACKQDAVFVTVRFDIVYAVMLNKGADDLLAGDWADLLVDKAAVVCNRQLQNVAFNKF